MGEPGIGEDNVSPMKPHLRHTPSPSSALADGFKCLFSIYNVPDSLRPSLPSLLSITPNQGSRHYFSHFTDEEMEAQKDSQFFKQISYMICLKRSLLSLHSTPPFPSLGQKEQRSWR